MDHDTLFIAVLILLLYFVPFIVAVSRDSSNSATVFFVNLLLGWTVIGWIAAIIIAVVSQTKAAVEIERATLKQVREMSR